MLSPGMSRSEVHEQTNNSPAPSWLRRRWIGIAVAVALAIAPAFGIAMVAAQLGPAATQPSPATGPAQVIAQGIAPVDDGEFVWRAALFTAQPRGATPPVSRPLGWVVASDAPILLTNENPHTGEMEYDSRLAPGEAAFVRPDTVQERASLDATPTTYVAMELVPALTAGQVDGGILLFMSPAFTLSAGDRDLGCVGALLRPGDTTVIPDVGVPVAIFATDGAIDVIPSGERARTLQVGESAIFTGDIEIVGSDGTLGSGGMRAFMAQGEPGQAGGAFVAAVIGPEIPPPPATDSQPMTEATTPSPPMPMATATPTEPPAPTPTETPRPPREPDPTSPPTTPPDPQLPPRTPPDEEIQPPSSQTVPQVPIRTPPSEVFQPAPTPTEPPQIT